jgi:hypothetical protein
MKEFLKVNVLLFYTQLHAYKYLNHLEACRISITFWQLSIELFEVVHIILIQVLNLEAQIPFAQ